MILSSLHLYLTIIVVELLLHVPKEALNDKPYSITINCDQTNTHILVSIRATLSLQNKYPWMLQRASDEPNTQALRPRQCVTIVMVRRAWIQQYAQFLQITRVDFLQKRSYSMSARSWYT